MKNWFKEKWTKTKEFCVSHPDGVLTVIGGVLGIFAVGLECHVKKNEYEDNVFTDIDGSVYKIPCRKMKTLEKVSK